MYVYVCSKPKKYILFCSFIHKTLIIHWFCNIISLDKSFEKYQLITIMLLIYWPSSDPFNNKKSRKKQELQFAQNCNAFVRVQKYFNQKFSNIFQLYNYFLESNIVFVQNYFGSFHVT